ncbi:hypothetical protein MBCUT_19520 [Methanobrevibacter cuticularis]|uniref:DUF371 domain-containing protein n=1 Tax=Methanobrevibacter cuticularis TaxID=47311 RepID=A0A166CQC4_9EURY|nr:DUF371 domain-containing protein [Methanobrevibacter cuticularis]KZX14759.1 hypothetical protein MBCUT_19520 [Methanobrevibacter cuticularis]
MKINIKAKGHKNVTSKHKSTFELTQDKGIGISADCIIGVSSDKNMNDFSDEIKKKIANRDTKIKVMLSTTNGNDEIIGYGHPDLTLNHPTDIVCRKSSYTCSRTLMINSNKASSDLNQDLINDLKNGAILNCQIIIIIID